VSSKSNQSYGSKKKNSTEQKDLENRLIAEQLGPVDVVAERDENEEEKNCFQDLAS
jgi:hypothetical protein